MNNQNTSSASKNKELIKNLAKRLLVRSLKSYMAKTLHAFEDYALDTFHVRLKICIKAGSPECFEEISEERGIATQAYILTKWSDDNTPPAIPAVDVDIRIHREASDSLVKFIILHELWHLHIELTRYDEAQKAGKKWTWRNNFSGKECHNSAEEEKDCNLFAALLSFYLDQLYTCENLRKQYKKFYTGPRTNNTPEEDILGQMKKNLHNYIISGRNFIRPVSFADLVNDGLQEDFPSGENKN